MSEKKSSTVRRRVCRVAASMTIAGEQDTSVRVATATTGEAAVAVRIGTMLIYVEDTKALTCLVESVVGASALGDDRLYNPALPPGRQPPTNRQRRREPP